MKKTRATSMQKQFLILIGFVIVLSSCNTKTALLNKKINREIARTHKSIAIVPPLVKIEFANDVSKDSITKLQKIKSQLYQKAIYDWMIGAQIQGKINKKIKIQDIDTTNMRLLKEGKLGYYSDGDSLGVDGVVGAMYFLYMPHKSLPVGFNNGMWRIFRKKSVGFFIFIKDVKTKTYIFSYYDRIIQLNGNASSRAIINVSMDKAFQLSLPKSKFKTFQETFPYQPPMYFLKFGEWLENYKKDSIK